MSSPVSFASIGNIKLGFHAEYTTSKELMSGIAGLAEKYKAPVSTSIVSQLSSPIHFAPPTVAISRILFASVEAAFLSLSFCVNGVPIYDQIYSQIKAQIINGTLEEDAPLPSIRNLAKENSPFS